MMEWLDREKRRTRLQILTIEELLSGKQPDLPPLAINAGFKEAPREEEGKTMQRSMFGDEVAPLTTAVRSRIRYAARR